MLCIKFWELFFLLRSGRHTLVVHTAKLYFIFLSSFLISYISDGSQEIFGVSDSWRQSNMDSWNKKFIRWTSKKAQTVKSYITPFIWTSSAHWALVIYCIILTTIVSICMQGPVCWSVAGPIYVSKEIDTLEISPKNMFFNLILLTSIKFFFCYGLILHFFISCSEPLELGFKHDIVINYQLCVLFCFLQHCK